jgi:hypothetical protein
MRIDANRTRDQPLPSLPPFYVSVVDTTLRRRVVRLHVPLACSGAFIFTPGVLTPQELSGLQESTEPQAAGSLPYSTVFHIIALELRERTALGNRTDPWIAPTQGFEPQTSPLDSCLFCDHQGWQGTKRAFWCGDALSVELGRHV